MCNIHRGRRNKKQMTINILNIFCIIVNCRIISDMVDGRL